ncbi:MAG: carbohydrate kinase [Oscillospiraceae bacterium]|nr:carbohydrate kinase [Oscillospiraceae bacterium]
MGGTGGGRVCCFGEVLIDFTKVGLSEGGRELYERNPGGAVANLAVAVARLGGSSSLIGMVGADMFGDYLKEVVAGYGVDARGILTHASKGTTLAFVSLAEDGECGFAFYRDGCADCAFTAGDIPYGILGGASAFHYGSLSLTHPSYAEATFRLIEHCSGKGMLLSYDPNYRPPLWRTEAQARDMMLKGLAKARVVKVSRGEMAFLTGTDDLASGSGRLMEGGAWLSVVTMGKEGCYYRLRSADSGSPEGYADATGLVGGYAADAVDTTGAGDCFWGCVLHGLMRRAEAAGLTPGGLGGGHNPLAIGTGALEAILRDANAAAAHCVSGYGGMPSMPTPMDLERVKSMVD